MDNTLSFTNEQFYDPVKGTLQFDVPDLALSKPGWRNQIRLRRLKNKLDKQEIDGITRLKTYYQMFYLFRILYALRRES